MSGVMATRVNRRTWALAATLLTATAAVAQSTPSPATQNPPPVTSQTPVKPSDPTAPTAVMSKGSTDTTAKAPHRKAKTARQKRKQIVKNAQANPTV